MYNIIYQQHRCCKNISIRIMNKNNILVKEREKCVQK